MDLLLGLLEPQQGKILVDDRDIRQDLAGWQRSIGYVPQTVFLTDDSLESNIVFGDEVVDRSALEQAVQLAGMETWIRNLPEGLESNVGERGVGLSGGQRQKIGIARAFYRKPSLLVLDEPTSALDDNSKKNISDLILRLKNKKTVILVTHSKQLAEICESSLSLVPALKKEPQDRLILR